ncbi:IclR family transcriptional regulator [Microbacterium halophytorum]|uniref:IclR family transcriptional regulator n=1 Tax=Microbacterium halophytorum TaxID=2067568 RepID=UPI000CFE1134|nr:IclR family transcriptional regulator [Microbacterium halophytorum]
MAHRSEGKSALARQLAVLDAFDPLHPFLTLSEIARAADLPVSTAHRIVNELVREGLLERHLERSYRLGVRLWEYAARTPGAVGLREVARVWCEAVHRRVGQHTQLGILQGSDVLYIDRLSNPDAVINGTLVGGRLPAHASASGLVLLAHAEPHVVDAVCAAPMRRFTSLTISSAAALRPVLERIRGDGFMVTDGHIHLEARSIAVPVRGPGGRVIAAIAVVVPNDDAPVRPVIDLLTAAAVGISRDLVRASGEYGDVAPETLGLSKRSLEFVAELDAERRHAAA